MKLQICTPTLSDIDGQFPVGTEFSPPEHSTKHLTEKPSPSKIKYCKAEKGFGNSPKGAGGSVRAPSHSYSLLLYVTSLICEHL